LENDLAGCRVRDRLKRAKAFEVYRYRRALGIGDFPELGAEIIPNQLATPAGLTPLDFPLTQVARGHNICDAVSVEHVTGSDIRRASRTEVDDKICLPTLDQSRDYSGRVCEQELIRSDGQVERSIGTEVVCDVVCGQSVVLLPIRGIGVTGCGNRKSL